MLEEITPRGQEGYGEFYTVTETGPDEVLAIAGDHDTADHELLARHEDGGSFEFLVSDDCPAVVLSERDGLPRRVGSVDGRDYIAAEVPASTDESRVVDRFLNSHPDAKLETKRQQPYSTPTFGHRKLQHAIERHLLTASRKFSQPPTLRAITTDRGNPPVTNSPTNSVSHRRRSTSISGRPNGNSLASPSRPRDSGVAATQAEIRPDDRTPIPSPTAQNG